MMKQMLHRNFIRVMPEGVPHTDCWYLLAASYPFGKSNLPKHLHMRPHCFYK